jgi:hypothetical protein
MFSGVRVPAEIYQINDGIKFPVVNSLNVEVVDLCSGFSGTGPVRDYKNLDGVLCEIRSLITSGASDGITELTGDVNAGPGSGSQAATIPANTITFAKMQDIATDRLIGRDTAGSGDPEELIVTSGLEFTGVGGIQRSALTGDVTAPTGSNATTIANDAVSDAKLRNSAGFSVIGKTNTGTGDPADIVAADETVLGRTAAGNLIFAQVATGQVADAVITYPKIQDISAASRLLGRGAAAGAGDVEEITFSSPLSMTGADLTVIQATESLIGAAEIATQAEVDAGSDDLRYITPLKLASSSLIALTMQDTYDNTGGVPHIVVVAGQPFTVRDAAVPTTDIFAIQQNSGTNIWRIREDELDMGPIGDRTLAIVRDEGGRGGIRYMPDGRTVTNTPAQTYVVQWDSLVITDIPGGGGIGNDTAPAMIGSIGECQFDDSGNLFSSSLLFNQGSLLSLNGVSAGPIYTMVNQPTMRNVAAGSRTFSQHNALRIQAKWGPNTAGNLTQTSCEYLLFTAFVDATVGTVGVTTMNYMAAKDVTLTAGGTIGTLTVLDIDNITGPSVIYGINSAMSAADFFIRHTGSSPSTFGGIVYMENAIAMNFGDVGANGVQLLRSAAGVLTMAGVGGSNNEDLEFDFDSTANVVKISSSTGGRVQIDTDIIAFGATSPSGTPNWFIIFDAPAMTITVPGDFSNVLSTSGGSHTIDAALSKFAQRVMNAPAGTIGTGSVVDGSVLTIQGNVAVGTNRYGLHVTSSPSSGTLNYCARFQGAAGVRIDGVLEHTGSTLGFFGTAPTTKPSAYTLTNVSTDRSYDANSTTVDELADVVGTLVADLQSMGLVG